MSRSAVLTYTYPCQKT